MKIEVKIRCPFCGTVHSVSADLYGIYAWTHGTLIQNALPDLSATEREQLISKLCPDCQKDIFG